MKGVCDANANALDKALDALLLFLQNTTEAQAARSALQPCRMMQMTGRSRSSVSKSVNLTRCCRISGPTCSNIASKVLKGRPATVKKAADACLAFVEWEQVDAVLVSCPVH